MISQDELPGYNKAALMALAGLALMVNCASGIDILADFDTDIKQHVGGNWVLSAFSVLGALGLLVASIELKKKDMIQPSTVLKVGGEFTDKWCLLCIAQAIIHAVKMGRGFVDGLLDVAISCIGAAIVLGSALNNAKNVSEERSKARIN